MAKTIVVERNGRRATRKEIAAAVKGEALPQDPELGSHVGTVLLPIRGIMLMKLAEVLAEIYGDGLLMSEEPKGWVRFEKPLPANSGKSGGG